MRFGRTGDLSDFFGRRQTFLEKTSADNLPWICVRDGNGVYSTNVSIYNIHKVPAVFLINLNNELELHDEILKIWEATVKSLL